MSFAHPSVLVLCLAALPVLGIFFWWAWRVRCRLIEQFIPIRLQEALPTGLSPRRIHTRALLLALAVASLLAALARPRYGMGSTEVNQRGLDILIGIDTSRSMLAEDAGPGITRLQRARLAALDLARSAKRDRVGLIAFAGTAFLQCPLTVDDEAFRQSVDGLDTGIIPQGGTALGPAIDTALEAVSTEQDNVRVLVLFTDGEEHEPGALDAAKRAQSKGLRVYTVGVGTTRGEVIRLRDANGVESFLKDDQGNVVKSSMNEPLLRELAAATGGFYLPLQGAKAMEELYTKGLQPLPRSEFSSRLVQQYRERFQWPLALALVFLMAEFHVPERGRDRNGGRSTFGPSLRPTPQSVGPRNFPAATATSALPMLLPFGLALLGALAGACSASASPRSAFRQFERGEFEAAQGEYERLARERPDDQRLGFNAGVSAYRAQDFGKAAEHFSDALRSTDLGLQRDAFYNLGNTQFRRGQAASDTEERSKLWEQAIRNFDSALKLAPDATNALQNRDFVRRQLEELRRQQPPKQQKQKGDQNQEQQSKDQDQDQDQDQAQNQDQRQDKDQKQDQETKSDSKDTAKDQTPSSEPSPPSRDDASPDSQEPQDRKDSSEASKPNTQDNPSQEKQSPKPAPKPGQEDPKAKENQAGQKGKEDQGSKGEQAQPESGQEGDAATGDETPLGRMSPKQALRLLDTAKGEEKLMPLDKRKARPRVFKDW